MSIKKTSQRQNLNDTVHKNYIRLGACVDPNPFREKDSPQACDMVEYGDDFDEVVKVSVTSQGLKVTVARTFWCKSECTRDVAAQRTVRLNPLGVRVLGSCDLKNRLFVSHADGSLVVHKMYIFSDEQEAVR